MLRRLALLGLLSLSACNFEDILDVPDSGTSDPPTTGTVTGTLTPFRASTASPAPSA